MAKSGSIYDPSRKHKTPKGFSSKDLCALCCLFVHPLVFIRGGSGERKIFFPKGEKTQSAEIRENAEGMKKRTMPHVFSLLE
jgi:hypothetical protein